MKIQSYNLRNRMNYLFIEYSLVALVIIFIFVSFLMMRQSLKEYELSTHNRVSRIVDAVNRELYVTLNKSAFIVNNYAILEGLKRNYTDDLEGHMLFVRTLDLYCSSLNTINEKIGAQIIFHVVNESLSNSKYIRKINEYPDERIQAMLKDKKSDYVVWDNQVSINDNAENSISLYRNIYSYSQYLGYLEICIPVEFMNDALKMVELRKSERAEIITQEGESLFLNSTNGVYKNEIVTYGTTANEYQIKLSLQKSEFYLEYFKQNVIYFLIFAFLFLLGFLFSKNKISAMTRELYLFIDDITDNKAIEIDPAESEVFLIKKRFQELLLNERRLQQDMLEMKGIKKSMELELLQTRINPHLLYNSLSNIKWHLMKYRNIVPINALDSLTSYYRIALNNGNTVISIEKELEMIYEFVQINEFLIGSKIKFDTDIEDSLLKCYTFKLLLQPIVENAIAHGIADMENGEINLSIHKTDGDILIEISDNGRGMPQEKIDALLSLSYETKNESYGIKNTIERIKIYYGEAYGIRIQSQPGRGTTVQIRIAMLTKDELKNRFYV